MSAGGTWEIDRGDYDRLLDLPYSGWGWEYKRRDASLKKAARRAARTGPTVLKRHDGSALYRLNARQPEAESFGLHFFPDPSLSALETIPFWLPEVMTSGLDAASEMTGRMGPGSSSLRWDDLPGEKHFLIAPGRRPKLIIAAPGYAAQLAIEEKSLPVPKAVYLSLRLGAGHLMKNDLRHVEEFAAFCVGQAVTCRPIRGLSAEKLRDALIALDGHLAGATQRQIANAVFGAKTIADDWNRGPKSYKSKTRRLIKKGVSLMEYGYKDLL